MTQSYLVIKLGETMHRAKRHYFVQCFEDDALKGERSFRTVDDLAAFLVNRVGEDEAQKCLDEALTINVY